MDRPMVTPGFGWVTFAAVMLGMVGVFNVIDGIVAVTKDDYVLDDLLFGDLTAWGWFFIIWGAIQIAASLALFSGATWAAAVGIAAAFLNAIAQLGWLRHYPIWSVIIIAVDVLVIYGLAVYGGRREVVSSDL